MSVTPQGIDMSVRQATLQETWDALAKEPNAVLVDVRTVPEWQFVGVPDLSPVGKQALTLSWAHYPNQPNPEFVDQVREAGVTPEHTVYLLCRSGARSQAAAAALSAAGYPSTVNVVAGFEGHVDQQGHRHGGWKDELPWRQS